LAAIVGALAMPAAAWAQDEVPPGSGPDQYIEGLPGAGGNRIPGAGNPGQKGTQLSKSVRGALARERQGRALERLATDPALGAPRSGRTGSPASVPPLRKHDSLASGATNTFFGSEGGGIAVLAALVLITGAGAFVAIRRVRRRRVAR
jgi:hypothetical protein